VVEYIKFLWCVDVQLLTYDHDRGETQGYMLQEAPTKLSYLRLALESCWRRPRYAQSRTHYFTGKLPYVVCSDFLFSEVVVGDIVLLSTGNCLVEGVL
jgi:hypothetical protein